MSIIDGGVAKARTALLAPYAGDDDCCDDDCCDDDCCGEPCC